MVALVRYADEALWGSCLTINTNLASAYEKAFPDCQSFFLPRNHVTRSDERLREAVEAVVRARPERIVFVDDPNPAPFILELKRRLGHHMPPLYFHVYGDFVFGARDWLSMGDNLQGTLTKFICSSRSQANLLGGLLLGADRLLDLCPFPLEAEKFYFDQNIRAQARASFQLKPNDTMLVYTGRMTFQKNVIRLVREFVEFAKTEANAHLFLAGGIDHLGGPYDSMAPIPGFFYHQYQRVVNEAPSEVSERIHFLGHVDQAELNQLYNAADAFASLSTFHDEDFGMSPAEALMCGAPALLTRWGGYASFETAGALIKFVPTHLNAHGLYLRSADIQTQLKKVVADSDLNRETRARKFAEVFAIDPIAQRIREIHGTNCSAFLGFTEDLNEIGRRMSGVFEANTPAFYEGMNSRSFYSRVYQSYVDPVPKVHDEIL